MSNDTHVIHDLRPRQSPLAWMLLLLVIAAAAAGGAWMLDKRNKERAAGEAAAKKAVAAEAAGAALAQKVTQLEAEKAELSAAKDALTRDMEAKVGELEQLKGTADKLQEQMKDEIAKGDIRLSEAGGKLRVDLVDKILFDSGEAQISKRGEGVLGRVGAVLAAIDDKQIQVSGHTDKTPISEKLVPQFPTNWELSTARATNVVRFLSEKAGVPAERLVASGYGEFHPVASNKSPAGRARNRRIEILLTPTLAPKAIASKAGPSKPSPSKPGPSKPGPSKPVQRVANNTKPGKR
jgi:chemotaxis protein MotB